MRVVIFAVACCKVISFYFLNVHRINMLVASHKDVVCIEAYGGWGKF